MRNLFLMALFGLFMFAGISTQQSVSGYIATPALAEGNSDNNDSGNSSESKDSNKNDSGSKDGNSNDNGSKDSNSNDNGSKDSNDGGNDSGSKDSNSDDQASNGVFHCPAGITSCYRADGSLYDDPNNLPATAAGPSSGASSGPALVPVHMRSF